MRIRYDPTSGALYFRVREGAITETVELPTPGSYVDVDESGTVLGLEFLSVHEFLGFLVAMGGEASVPERINPARPGPDLQRLSNRDDPGAVFVQSMHETRAALGEVMERAEAAAQQAHERAGQAAGQVSDVHESSIRLSRQFFENWVKTIEEIFEESEKGQPNATKAAIRKAEELGVDLTRVEGTGAGGLITVKDVMHASHRRN